MEITVDFNENPICFEIDIIKSEIQNFDNKKIVIILWDQCIIKISVIVDFI